MKKNLLKLISLLLILPMLMYSCNEKEGDGQEEEETEQGGGGQQEEDTPKPVEEIEIVSGETYLATNPNIEKFLQEVHYTAKDWSKSLILRYPGGFPDSSDIPSSYYLKWEKGETPNGSELELKEYDKKGGTLVQTRKKDIDKVYTKVEITNLMPNAYYTYKLVAKTSEKVLKEGEFYTTGSLHHVFFHKAVQNARDLGGWLTEDKTQMVKYRMIYRGGRLQSSTITKKGKNDMLTEGIKAQLDLRGDDDRLFEADEAPEGTSTDRIGPAVEGMEFCSPSIGTGGPAMLGVPGSDGKEYCAKTIECFRFIFDCIAADKPVYFHCSLGRDRTGTLALLILGLLKVYEGDISQEYELTYFAPKGWSVADSENYTIYKNNRTEWAYKPTAKLIWDEYVGEGETFADGVAKFLINKSDGQITQADIDAFRAKMLVPAPVK